MKKNLQPAAAAYEPVQNIKSPRYTSLLSVDISTDLLVVYISL